MTRVILSERATRHNKVEETGLRTMDVNTRPLTNCITLQSGQPRGVERTNAQAESKTLVLHAGFSQFYNADDFLKLFVIVDQT